MDRREFFIKGVGLLAIPLIITQIGCDNNPTGSNNENNDNNTDNDSTGGSGGSFKVTSSQNSGHTHTVEIQDANVETPPSMDITLTSSTTNHSHQITLTQGDFQALRIGETIVKTSTVTGSHSHTFSIKVSAS